MDIPNNSQIRNLVRHKPQKIIESALTGQARQLKLKGGELLKILYKFPN